MIRLIIGKREPIVPCGCESFATQSHAGPFSSRPGGACESVLPSVNTKKRRIWPGLGDREHVDCGNP